MAETNSRVCHHSIINQRETLGLTLHTNFPLPNTRQPNIANDLHRDALEQLTNNRAGLHQEWANYDP
jgi:hypothetical protein